MSDRAESADTVDQIARHLLGIADALRNVTMPALSVDQLALLEVALAAMTGDMADVRGDEVAGALRVILHA